MNGAELAVAILLSILGVRSLLVWGRRRIESRSVRDHALYALFVTGRVGVWFGLAAMFFAYAFARDDGSVKGLVIVPLVLGAVSVLCSWALGRSPRAGG